MPRINDPSRGATRRTLAERVRLPLLSDRASAAWLVACFAVSGVLIPVAYRLPVWIRFELVLAAWWLVWWLVLGRLLFTGQRVTDDHELRGPRNWFGSDEPVQHAAGGRRARDRNANASWWDGFFWGSISDSDSDSDVGEFLATIVVIIVGLIVFVGVVWFLFEVAIPLVVFVLYFVARGMLATVINDRHHCRGRAARALAFAALWATLYTAPLAGVVWFVHVAHARHWFA